MQLPQNMPPAPDVMYAIRIRKRIAMCTVKIRRVQIANKIGMKKVRPLGGSSHASVRSFFVHDREERNLTGARDESPIEALPFNFHFAICTLQFFFLQGSRSADSFSFSSSRRFFCRFLAAISFSESVP
jgi:hypothetical protein